VETGAGAVTAGIVAVTAAALGCRVDCHFITSAPPSAPTATNSPICNGFMLQFSVISWTNRETFPFLVPHFVFQPVKIEE
jgi:hypothetical protein